MGWFNSLGPGIAPPDRGIVGEDELETLRKRAEQAGQLTSLGAESGMAQRWSGVPEPPPELDVMQSFQGPWNLGSEEAPQEDSGLDWGFSLGPRGDRPKQPAPTLADVFGAPDPEEVQRRQMLGEGGTLAPQAAAPGAAPSGIGARPSASTIGDPQAGSPSEFRARIEQDQRDQQARRQQGLEANYARGLQRLEGGPLPGFEYGPPRGLADVAGREIGGAGLRSGDGVTSGLDVFDRPDGSSVYRSQADDSIYATSARRASDEELAGLRAGAFNASPGADPQAAALMRLAGAGSGGGHIMQGVEGPDVSQASLEHAMAQRAAQAQLSGLESQARQQGAQADAAERDPLGIERYRAQQAIQDARWAAQNQGRLQTSLADDQFRAQQKTARDAEVQKITTDYLDTRRALEEELARLPPNAPPDSLEAAKAAEIQRELDRNERQTELELAQRGVRINSGT